MNPKLQDSFSFFDATIRNDRHIYICLANDEASEQKVPITNFVVWRDGNFGGFLTEEWLSVCIAMVGELRVSMIAVGEAGEVLIAGDGVMQHESTLPMLIDNKGPLRRGRIIDGQLYVAGMGGQVYRRSNDGTWKDLSLPSRPLEGFTGFEDIHGFSALEIYTVGWDGALAEFDGTKWTLRSVPTNLVLTSVCCAGDGYVYASGRRGLLLRGRHEMWECILQDEIHDDIWDLCWFNGALYLSTMRELLRIDNGSVQPVDFGPDGPGTCFRLPSNNEVMCSVGAKDVMLFDGQTWTRIA